jgi:PAS domain S-box-containing protein
MARPPKSLASLLALFLAGSALLLTVVLVIVIGYVATGELRLTIGKRVAERAQHAAVQLDVSMYERYREVQNLAARPELASPLADSGARRAILEQLQRTYPLYAWLGLTDNDGKVLASAGGLLQGADVSQRPWFAEIRRNVRVHDVHDAKLLASLVPADEGAPQRFVDISFPYFDADGAQAGVLGAHLSWRWARQMQDMFSIPKTADASTLIVSSAGQVLSGPAALIGSTISMPSFVAAQSQQRGYVEETWADGKRYLVGYARTRGYGAYPGLGWVVLARQDSATAYIELAKLRDQIIVAGIGVALLFSVLGWLLARKITRPLLRAAEGAHAIEQGQRHVLDASAPGYGELDKLIGAFNHLLDRLGKQRGELNLANARLEQRVADRTADLKQSLEAVHASELRLRTILETAQDAFVGMDGDGYITDWNTQAEHMFGWRHGEIAGQPLEDVVLPADARAALRAGLAQAVRAGAEPGPGRRLLLTAVRRDGAAFPVELTIGQVRVAGALSFGVFFNDISERTRAEKALESERVLLNAVLETIDVAVVACDRNGELTLFNRFSREVHSQAQQAVHHTDWARHYALFEADGVTPLAADQVPLIRALRGEVVNDVPIVIVPADGAVRHMLCSGRQLVLPDGGPLGAVVVMSDVTQRHQAQRKLADSERFLRAVTDNTPALIAYIDRQRRFRFANRAHESAFGLDRDAMLGQTVSEVLGAAVDADLAPHIRAVLAGQAVHFESSFNDRWPGYYMLDLKPDADPDGGVRGFHVMVMDISQRRKAELAAAASEIKARAASRAKSEFVANMSHEIRTPMNAVLGVTHLLLQTTLTAEQDKLVGMIRTCGKALVQIINDILDFSRIEAGKIDIASAPFALADIIDVISIAMLGKGAGGAVAYLLDVGPDLDRVYVGDALRVQQVLLNLVSNAVKFTEHGSVTVVLRSEAIDAQRTLLRVAVRDTGIGMNEEQQARLFGAFEQADSSTSRRFGGSGLGLTIARQLAQLMGATLTVTSTLGQGSEFVFSVPLVHADTAAGTVTGSAGALLAAPGPARDGARRLPPGVTRLSSSPEPDAGAASGADSAIVSLHGLRILLVEDNPLNQVVARGMLEPSGATVTVANNGQLAVERFRAAPQGFDLVLMDVQMPVMDGYAATSMLRGELGVTVPILAMSAGVMESEQARCRQVGMDDFIAKPVDYDQMMAVISRYAASTRQQAAAAAVAAPRIAGVIDLSVLLRFSAPGTAQRAALVQLLTRVRDNAPDDYAAALATFDSGDAVTAARQLHTLRGSVGSLGAARFTAAALALEIAIKEGAATATLQAQAAAELDAVVSALANWLATAEAAA